MGMTGSGGGARRMLAWPRAATKTRVGTGVHMLLRVFDGIVGLVGRVSRAGWINAGGHAGAIPTSGPCYYGTFAIGRRNVGWVPGMGWVPGIGGLTGTPDSLMCGGGLTGAA